MNETYAISRSVENFLEKNQDVTRHSKKIIASSIMDAINNVQKRLDGDLQQIALKSSRDVAKDLQNSIYELTASAWFNNQERDMVVVPEGTKFLHKQGARLYIAIEEKVHVRTIYYKLDGFDQETYRIALPYVLFVFPVDMFVDDNAVTRYALAGARIAFLTQPLTSLEQRIYHPCLPNIDNTRDNRNLEHLKICMGRSYKPDIRNDLTTQIENYRNHFWQSPFGKDWDHEFIIMGKKDVNFASFKAWAKATEENPLFVLDAPFREAGTLNNLIRLQAKDDMTAINVPLKKIVNVAVNDLTMDIIKALRQADLARGFDTTQIDKLIYQVSCEVTRNCVENIVSEISPSQKEDFNTKRDKVSDDLNALLENVNKKLSDKGKTKSYWNVDF